MNEHRLLPLEEHLRSLAASEPHRFPDRTVDYFTRYCAIKDHLRRTAYRNAGAGLAADDKILYTHHDGQHVEDVIETAGRLLGLATQGITDDKRPCKKLQPYEVYAILVGILLHDAGNAEGRQDHERRSLEYLSEMGEAVVGKNRVEQRHLAAIARAHGGKAANKSKDTIGTSLREEIVDLQNDVTLRARLAAAIIRFADELSENPSRSNPFALKKPYRSPQAVIHNLYSELIQVNIDLPGKTVKNHYVVPLHYLAEKFPDGDREVYLIDYIAGRLLKCDRERRYCQRFFQEILSIECVRATVEFEHEHELLDAPVLTAELREKGYPDEGARDGLSDFNGEQLAALAANLSPAKSE